MTTLKKLDSHDLASPYDVLAATGLKPWTSKDIKVYMRRQVWKHTNWAGLAQKVLPPNFGVYVFLTCLLSLVGLVAGLGAAITLGYFTMIYVFLPLSTAIMTLMFLDSKIEARTAEWRRVTVESVLVTMPAFALAAWKQARLFYPEATFVVLELRDSVTRGLLDPILIMEVGHPGNYEQIPLKVWDEKGKEVPPPR